MLLEETKAHALCIARSSALRRPVPTVAYPGHFKARRATHAHKLSKFSLSCSHSHIRVEREGRKKRKWSFISMSLSLRDQMKLLYIWHSRMYLRKKVSYLLLWSIPGPGQHWINTSFGTDEGKGRKQILIFYQNPSLTFEIRDLPNCYIHICM